MYSLSDGLLALAALSQLARAMPAQDAANANPTVTLASGVVVGTTTTMPTATAAANKFLGIPFAASPPLRFGPPKPAPAWKMPLQATTLPPACLQAFSGPESTRNKTEVLFNNPGFAPPKESEDCMYLNVFTPPGTTASSKKAVMLWIYGGNLAFGTGAQHQFDGTSFATNQDVITVTPNYRTNAFGFPGSPELEAPYQNLGFLDQRFALQWVQDNIAKFGGDPTKVTIFGESAGGYSVKQLVALPPSPLPFHAAIMESEAALTGNAAEGWDQLVRGLNCSSATSQLACVRSKPGKQIRSVVDSKGIMFSPTQDGVTYVTNVGPNITAGTAAKVPILLGNNQDEARFFLYLVGLDSPNANIDTILKTFFPGQPALQATLAQLAAGQPAYEAGSTFVTEETFLCPTSRLASLFQAQGYPVYRYLYNTSFPNADAFPDAGAYHSAEMTEVWGTYFRHNSLGPATAQEIRLSAYMQTAWANFAKTPAKGPMEGWPLLGSKGMVQDLGVDGIYGGRTVTAASIDQSCTLFDPILEQQGY